MIHDGIGLLLLILRGVGALIGLVFFAIVARTWLRTRSRPMFVLGLATGLLTLGTLAEGAALQFLGQDALDTAHIVESVLFLLAFSVLLYSVLVPERVHRQD